MFDDLLAANRRYIETFKLAGIPARARKGLAVLTCMDSRIEPLAMLGLVPGDAKIIRNAGARVTDDVLRTLVLASNLLGVERVCVVQHTDCRMTQATEEEIAEAIQVATGADTTGWEFLAFADQRATIQSDVERIRSCPLMAPGLTVSGFVYDVHSGRLELMTD